MLLDGRVAIVTGASRGLGLAHARELAAHGARVLTNDLDGEVDVAGDCADWKVAERMIATALDRWGRVDVLVNNAGIVRDRMFVNAEEEEWDAVMRVHLKGHFAPTRHAAAWWREAAKKGEAVDARIINTTSGAGLQGSVGQAAYSAAKGGIASLTLVQAAELARYGVTANAIAPAARTRMTEETFAEMMKKPEHGFDAMAPENVSPLVAWLASAESRGITGRVFEVQGGVIAVAEGWQTGPRIDRGARWDAREIGPTVRELLAQAAPPAPVYGARS
jgi:NAD(P)-dependent dehydrogenase (short-subunit alcohol dehydrogenase family)